MDKKIKDFIRDKGQKVLSIDYKGDINTLSNWHKVRNPMRTIVNYCVVFLSSLMFPSVKSFIFRHLLGMGIGKNSLMSPNTIVDLFYPELISMGDNVVIGWHVTILCHEFSRDKIRLGRVNIKDNALIGAFSIIRSGVTVGKNSVVAMDSFVNCDVPDNEMWGGVPAKKIKKIKL